MGIQINGSSDTISAADGSLTLEGAELGTVSGINVTGVVTATSYQGNGINVTGVVTATSYQGDGSALTGIGAGTSISVLNTNVTVSDTGSDGTITFTTDGTEALSIESDQDAKFAKRVFISANSNTGTLPGLNYLQLQYDTTNKAFITSYDSSGNLDDLTIDGDNIKFRVGSFSEAATIDSSGNVGVGIASPTIDSGNGIHIHNSTESAIHFTNSTSGTTSTDGAYIGYNSNALLLKNTELGATIRFQTYDSERARIDGSGRLLVGTTSSVGSGSGQYAKLQVGPSTFGSTSGGKISIQRGEAASAISSGSEIGQLVFSDNAGGDYAFITVRSDAAGGSSDYPGRIEFSTTADGASSPTEALRINSAQEISTNAYSTSVGGSCLALRQNTNSSNHNGIYQTLRSNANNTSTYHFRGLTESASNYFIYGNATAGSSSDERLKKNIETTRDGYLADIRQLRVVKFNWKSHEEGTPRELGLIAQEVEQVFPGLIQNDGGQVSEDDDTSYKVLKHSVLPFILLKALQEADQKIDDQAALIESQAATIAALDARLTALEGGN